MIGRLRGAIVDRGPESVILDVGGVGYTVAVTPRTLSELSALGEAAVLHTHLHVREDQLALFGFMSTEERNLFQVLLGISGVGPKVALAILATLTPTDLSRAVHSGDTSALTTVPGIGKRSAEKLMVELRPRMDIDIGSGAVSGSMSEARAALEGLGYAPDEIRGVLGALSPDLPVADLVKRSLQELGRSQP
ncbi:MAG: Holliday junction branch migration protein RuvA [Acidimicrobiia bacterium]